MFVHESKCEYTCTDTCTIVLLTRLEHVCAACSVQVLETSRQCGSVYHPRICCGLKRGLESAIKEPHLAIISVEKVQAIEIETASAQEFDATKSSCD